MELSGSNATGTTNTDGKWGSQIDAVSLITLAVWFVAIIYSRWVN